LAVRSDARRQRRKGTHARLIGRTRRRNYAARPILPGVPGKARRVTIRACSKSASHRQPPDPVPVSSPATPPRSDAPASEPSACPPSSRGPAGIAPPQSRRRTRDGAPPPTEWGTPAAARSGSTTASAPPTTQGRTRLSSPTEPPKLAATSTQPRSSALRSFSSKSASYASFSR
jgi:hypothetical protein